MECTEVDEPAQRAAKLRESASPKTGCADWASPSSRCSDHLSSRNLCFAKFHSESRASHLVTRVLSGPAARARRPPWNPSTEGGLLPLRFGCGAGAASPCGLGLTASAEFIVSLTKSFGELGQALFFACFCQGDRKSPRICHKYAKLFGARHGGVEQVAREHHVMLCQKRDHHGRVLATL